MGTLVINSLLFLEIINITKFHCKADFQIVDIFGIERTMYELSFFEFVSICCSVK